MSESLESYGNDPPFEGLDFLTVKSSALRARADITLFIPEPARPRRDVPLAVFLHGVHGSHWNWAVKGGLHHTAQRLIAAGRIPPLVLAMPSDGLWGDGSGYLKHPGQDFEKWIVDDVPAAVRAAAACLSERSPLFLCGLSMGGFGAMRLGAKYPARYRGLSAHSSITHFDQMQQYVQEDAGRFGAAEEDHSVLQTMLRQRGRLPPLRFDCGTADPLLEPNRQLHRDLEQHGIPHQYQEFPGGHDWAYWTARAEDSLLFFSQTL